jgi:hypothetical protein
MSTAFGRAIAEKASDPLIWMDPITSAYAGIPADVRNFGLLGGFLGGLSARHPGVVETFKQAAVNSETFAPTLPFVCTRVGLAASDVSLVLQAVNAGSLPPAMLRGWTFGGVLAALPAPVLAPLFDALFRTGGDAYSIALDLLGMYVHPDRTRLDRLRPQLRAAAANAGQRPKHSRFQIDEHHFKELMSWILNKGRGDPDAAAIALSLAKQVVPTGENHNDKLIKPLLPKLLREFPEIVWPILGEAITRDRATAWLMELSLGDNFAFHLKTPAILELPEEVLFAWCHAHPEAAPAFAAALLPILSSRNSDDTVKAFHPRMKRLLDEFGDRDDVLKALTRNMHTFGWSGSPADYYALYDEPLQTLETHPHSAARRWARNTRRQLSSQVEHVRTEEDERDADWGN